ncbi:MAG: aminoacyl-tRNA hydrolase [Dethiobacteria bacterium]
MFLFVGLGNPGLKYVHTRHNVGFWVIDELAARYNVQLKEVKCQSYFGKTIWDQKEVILAKPLTFMNRSGVAVAGLLRHFSLDPDNLLVIYDDLDLPAGRIRLRPGGGSGGHKGLASVIAMLGTENFPRLRLGIGRDRLAPFFRASDYVLSPFSDDEKPGIEEMITTAVDAVDLFLKRGISEAMNTYNAPRV